MFYLNFSKMFKYSRMHKHNNVYRNILFYLRCRYRLKCQYIINWMGVRLLCLLSSSAEWSSRLVALSSWSIRLSGFTRVTSTRPVAFAQPSSVMLPTVTADFLLRRSNAALPRSSEPVSTPLSTGDACDADMAVPLDVKL